MISLALVTPCAVICQLPSDGKVTVVVNAPALSAPVPGSAATAPPFGGVSQREIASPAVKPVPEKVTGDPLGAGVYPDGADAPDVTGTGAPVVGDVVTGAVVVPVVVPTA